MYCTSPQLSISTLKSETVNFNLRIAHGARHIMTAVITVGIQDQYLQMIKEGRKIWEGRLNNERYGSIEVGEKVLFESPTETLSVMILEKRVYPSFRDMLIDNGVPAFLPDYDDRDLDRAIETYRSFPAYREGESSLGAVAFKVKVQ